MVYAFWLFGLSLLFLLWERLAPRRRMPVLRNGFGTDLLYLILNGEYLGVLIGAVSIEVIARFDGALDLAGLREYVYMDVAAESPLWLQILILLVVFDLVQWGIHNLLHRVPWLWEFHKVHHSITEMDWIGNWRFHWFEVVFYKVLLYVPAAFFGFSATAMFWYAVISTFVGHFAHSNLGLRIGPLRYLLNSPEMHVWHHTHPSSGPINRNFGITLSVWDWLFGTAYVPEGRDPERLGFDDDEAFPRGFLRQELVPVTSRSRRERRHEEPHDVTGESRRDDADGGEVMVDRRGEVGK